MTVFLPGKMINLNADFAVLANYAKIYLRNPRYRVVF